MAMETSYHDNYSDQQRPGHETENGGFGYNNNNSRTRAHYGNSNNTAVSNTSTQPSTMQASSSSTVSSAVSTTILSTTSDAPTLTNNGMNRRLSTSSTARLDGKDGGPQIGFDEGIIQGLCDVDGPLVLLSDRIKQSIASCKQVASFFRGRADVEEKYGRSLVELGRNSNDQYARSEGKSGTFLSAYQQSLKVQETLAQNRLRFAGRLNEMNEELQALAREGEKQRKLHKDNGTRYQSILQESEAVMDKAKARFDATAEELERILVAKEGADFREAGMLAANQQPGHNGKKALGNKVKQGLFKAKNPAQLQRHEDDVRARMSAASEAFRKAVIESQALRAEYFNFQLPKVVRLLKDCADELDLGVQYHLTRYAFMYESAVVTEGTTLTPVTAPDDVGLKNIFESIDNRTDFKTFMQNYAVARNTPKGPRREGLYDEGYVPTLPPHVQASQNALAAQNAQQRDQQSQQVQQPLQSQTANGAGAASAAVIPPVDPYQPLTVPASSGATFGVELGEQLARDSTEIPKVVTKCAEAIEAYGLDSMGIYRLSGTTSKVQALKAALDKDVDGVNVMDEQWSSDINVISSALKLWFRELPEPLLTYGLYNGFMEAARYDNDRLRHIRLHEQVNELPDPNYATLKYFMGHLDRVRRKEGVNQMSASNLSIVFGPTLLGAPPEEGGLNLEHMNYQCKAIETILEKYQEIFVEEDDDGEKAGSAAPAPASGQASA